MDIVKSTLNDLKVELSDKFDQNFSRGGFFGQRWKPRADGVQTHLNNTGTLRRSITSQIRGNSLVFTSSTPYSAIHNEGGKITVTPKMKAYFWAMYKKTKHERYKAMALMSVGSHITIPQRRFLGSYQGINTTIERAIKRNVQQAIHQTFSQFKK